MKKFFSRFIIVFLIATLILGGFGFLGLFLGGYMSPINDYVGLSVVPVTRVFNMCATKIDEIKGYINGYDKLKEENEKLRRRISENETLIRSVGALERENEILREIIKISKKHVKLDLVTAQTAGQEFGNWGNSYTLDKGERDGVKEGNAVITNEGLVGVVTEVGSTWCRMASVIDTKMSVSAIVSAKGEMGICEGEFSLMRDGRLKLSYLDRETSVKVGDYVHTSGSGGMFPNQLYIGTVEEICIEENGITAYAVVKPAVDLTNINGVFIVKDFEQ